MGLYEGLAGLLGYRRASVVGMVRAPTAAIDLHDIIERHAILGPVMTEAERRFGSQEAAA